MAHQEKKWLTLNQHGKRCLKSWMLAISASDITTSELDYLYKKDLVDYAVNHKDADKRVKFAGHCLTDLGIETARHYFLPLCKEITILTP